MQVGAGSHRSRESRVAYFRYWRSLCLTGYTSSTSRGFRASVAQALASLTCRSTHRKATGRKRCQLFAKRSTRAGAPSGGITSNRIRAWNRSTANPNIKSHVMKSEERDLSFAEFGPKRLYAAPTETEAGERGAQPLKMIGGPPGARTLGHPSI